MIYMESIRTKPTINEGIVREAIKDGTLFVDYQPGNGTCYLMTFSDMTGLPGYREGRWYMVARVTNYKAPTCLIVQQHSWLGWRAVRERLGCGLPDSISLVELISHVTGTRCDSVEAMRQDMIEAIKNKEI